MRKSVLIVEDEQSIVDILSFILTKEGYDTLEAPDGPTGLQLALEQNPDLVLLDLMLPGMNGFEVCEKIRAAGCAVPIVMLTAREEEDDKVRGLELGADDYITKPFKNRELIARVRANIRRVSMVSAPPPEPAAGLPLGERMSVDEERAKELIHGFTTLDGYIRETWSKVFALVEATIGDQTLEWKGKSPRDEMLENYMKACEENRLKNTRILLNGLRFVSKTGQPLRMIRKLEPDPALLEQPLYH